MYLAPAARKPLSFANGNGPNPSLPARPTGIFTAFRRSIARSECLLERGFGSCGWKAKSPTLETSSGHWYFSLKDATAQVRCAMFRQRNMLCSFAAPGCQNSVGRARIGLYEPRGEYQLIVDHMEDAGLGALKRQFEELSAKLKQEAIRRGAQAPVAKPSEADRHHHLATVPRSATFCTCWRGAFPRRQC